MTRPIADPLVEVVVPVYNEEAILASSITRLRGYLSTSFPFRWRILIADNASTDRTLEIATSLAAEHDDVRVLHLGQKGRGRALRAAWLASDADVVTYTDVDLSTGLDALLPLVAPLVSGHSDVAIGSRLSASSLVARGPRREVISRVYNLLLRLVFSVRFRDAQCGFKAVRADIARRLVPAVVDEGWFFDTELLLLAEHNGLRIHEVPADWVDDPDSRVDVRRTALDDLRGVRRMVSTFLRGGGQIPLEDDERAVPVDDFGRQTVSFALIGATSTALSLALFLLLRDQLGAVTANAVGFTATTLGNAWANRRWTFRRRGTKGSAWQVVTNLVLYVMSLSVTTLGLLAVDGLTAEIAVLLVTWGLAAGLRFTLLRGWVYRRGA